MWTTSKESVLMMRCLVHVQTYRVWLRWRSFAFLPTAVIDMLLDKYPKAIPFDHDTVRDPDPSIRGWNDTTMVRIALEVLRLYLMGMDPYFRRVRRVLYSMPRKIP